jgi:hypothetical protein
MQNKIQKALVMWLTGMLLFSCHGYKEVTTQPEFDYYKNKNHVYVIKVQTKSGEIPFSEKMPGKMTQNGVSGIEQHNLVDFKSDSVYYESSRYAPRSRYAYKNGIRYDVYTHDTVKMVYNAGNTINIPYDDIQKVNLKIYKPAQTAGIIIGSVGILVGLSAIMISNMTFDLGVW